MNDPKWRKMKKKQAGEIEALLRSYERFCMNACSRYINRASMGSSIWTLSGNGNGIEAIIIHSRNSLYPVFAEYGKIPPLHFFSGVFGMPHIHSVQGRIRDSAMLEAEMEKAGRTAAEKIDYDLMCIDRKPSNYQYAGPANLIIRRPEASDLDSVAALHAEYEKEEVISAASRFDKAVSRLNTERIFKTERMLVAELDGRLIGKINTNAVTYTRSQIGGVYVYPEYRGLGVARRMTGEFTASLAGGVSLFVRRSNAIARSVYSRIGFAISGDYRISYY